MVDLKICKSSTSQITKFIMKRIYPDDIQLDEFLVLNENDYKVLMYCLDEMSIHMPIQEDYTYRENKSISQEEYDLCKAKILTRFNLQK